MIECVIPILKVADMSATLNYYVNVLGFTKEWEQGDMASVIRDKLSIYFNQGEQGNPGTWVWIGVEDVDVLYAEYVAKGAVIIQPPTNYPWACEMRIQDPDGHVLRIGSGPKEDEPFN